MKIFVDEVCVYFVASLAAIWAVWIRTFTASVNITLFMSTSFWGVGVGGGAGEWLSGVKRGVGVSLQLLVLTTLML